jgi:hypothetical protein
VADPLKAMHEVQDERGHLYSTGADRVARPRGGGAVVEAGAGSTLPELPSEALAVSGFSRVQHLGFDDPKSVMESFAAWLDQHAKGRPVFVSETRASDATLFRFRPSLEGSILF